MTHFNPHSDALFRDAKPHWTKQMQRTGDYKDGWRNGSRWVVARIHQYADSMNDQSARDALNACAHLLGKQAKEKFVHDKTIATDTELEAEVMAESEQ